MGCAIHPSSRFLTVENKNGRERMREREKERMRGREGERKNEREGGRKKE